MIKLCVHADAYALGIRNPVACLVRRFRIGPELAAAFAAEAEAILAEVADRAAAILNTPEAQGFRTLFERLGYGGQQPAGERLLLRTLDRGFRSHDNVIDAYNLASLRHAAGLGLHDAGAITTDVHVYRAMGMEQIRPLGRASPETVPSGDLLYGTAESVLAWLGRQDVDADDFKVHADSEHLLLVALGNAETSLAFNRTVCLTALQLLRKSCPEVYAQFVPTITGVGQGDDAQPLRSTG